MGWAEEVGGRHQPVKLFVTKSVSDGGDPEVVLLTQRLADNVSEAFLIIYYLIIIIFYQGLVDTALFHFDAMTGAEVGEAIASKYMLQGLDLIQGELVDAFLLSEPSKIVLAIDKYMQVRFTNCALTSINKCMFNTRCTSILTLKQTDKQSAV